MKILDALLVLQEQVINDCVNDRYYGICYNLTKITGDSDLSYGFVRDNCYDWDFFSGCNLFPIRGYDDEPLWEGKQLKLRLSLLDHLITKAKLLQV